MEIKSSDIKAVRNDTVLVKMIPEKEKTISGFYIPEAIRDKKLEKRRDAFLAEIIQFTEGADLSEYKTDIKVGNIVLLLQ